MDFITLALAKNYTRKKIAEMHAINNFEIVEALPMENISTSTIYLVKVSEGVEGNLYAEYVYTKNGWESLGTNINLEGYVSQEEFDQVQQELKDLQSSITWGTM